jgi:hypothetical protein
MKAERDDLVLRTSGALRTRVEVCARATGYAPRLLRCWWLSCIMSTRCRPANHRNDSLTLCGNNPCLSDSTRPSHGDQTRLTVVVNAPSRPGTPYRKVRAGLRSDAAGLIFARDQKLLLTDFEF